MNSFLRRVESLERRSTGYPMISASEASGIKSQLWSKLGISRQSEESASPLSHKAIEKARGSAIQRLQIFLDSHGA
jgi:hypothetical protein